MLIGCLIKNFKIYNNIIYAPITQSIDEAFSIFTGGNGVGKSSILEAINHFFNLSKWIYSKNGAKDEAFVAPIFLIKKTEFSIGKDDSLLELISNYFWGFEFNATNSTFKSFDFIKDFYQQKNKLKENFNPEEYYLFLVGFKTSQPANAYFSSLDGSIRALVESKGFEWSQCNLLMAKLKEQYSYIYIPVESSTKNLLKIESFELQELMDVDILNTIDGVLNTSRKVEKKKNFNSKCKDSVYSSRVN